MSLLDNPEFIKYEVPLNTVEITKNLPPVIFLEPVYFNAKFTPSELRMAMYPWLIPMSEINFLLRTYGHPAEVPRQFWNVSTPINPHDVPFLDGLMFEPLEAKSLAELVQLYKDNTTNKSEEKINQELLGDWSGQP